uniref:Uncharacterized protein n=1 Tax=Rhipicephalus zambeziensis TaxID=60191 RepID=A0A224Y573_9ACAR
MSRKQAHCAGSCQSIPTATSTLSHLSMWHRFIVLVFFLCVGLATVVAVLRASFECSCAFVADEAHVSALCIVFLDDVVSMLLACIWCCLSFPLFLLGPHFLARISSSAVLGARSETHSKEFWTCRFFFFSHCDRAGLPCLQSHYKWHELKISGFFLIFFFYFNGIGEELTGGTCAMQMRDTSARSQRQAPSHIQLLADASVQTFFVSDVDCSDIRWSLLVVASAKIFLSCLKCT